MKSIKKLYNENGMGYIGKNIPKTDDDLAVRWIKLDYYIKSLRGYMTDYSVKLTSEYKERALINKIWNGKIK
jgi:hypothetical protein